MKKLIDQCYLKAIRVLKRNSTKFGFKASYKIYDSVWGRDGCITTLGACLSGEKDLIETARKTLTLLKKFQRDSGQILNTYDLSKKRELKIQYYSSDASSWFVIAVGNYFKITRDKKFLKEFWPSVKKTIVWLRSREYDKGGLIDSLPAADWMDSSLQRQGKVLYNNCLYYKALKIANDLAKELNENPLDNEERIRAGINILFWPKKGHEGKFIHHPQSKTAYKKAINPKREYYLSHVIILEIYEDICDVFANILAILWNIADKEKRERILRYFLKKEISKPYPVRVLDNPVYKGYRFLYPTMDEYREKPWKCLPFCYHNGGIWPFVGGFYILALLKADKQKEAKKELEKLAEANRIGKEREWEFNEWLHGKNGKPMGSPLQSWNAAGYIMAYKAVKEGKIIL